MILTKTPYRVSLFGGGTDYSAYSDVRPGVVVGMAINKYCYVGVKRMPPGQMMPDGVTPIKYRVQYSKVDDVATRAEIRHPAVRAALEYFGIDEPLEFHCFGDLPGRSGLGGSSAFTVGLVHALARLFRWNPEPDPWMLARFAIKIEQDVIKETVGCQDQMFAAHGGLRTATFGKGGVYGTNAIDLPVFRLRELERSLCLVYSGTMRDAHAMAAKQVAEIPGKMDVLDEMRAQALKAVQVIEGDESLGQIGPMLNDAWMLKRSITPEVSSLQINELYARGLMAGALGGKLLGAGGGGFMLFHVHHNFGVDEFESRLGLPVVRFRIAHEGSRTIIDEHE